MREHTYFFSRKTLRKMLEVEGFEALRIETAGRYFPVWPVRRSRQALEQNGFWVR